MSDDLKTDDSSDDSDKSSNPNHGVNININAQPQQPGVNPAVRTDLAPQQAPNVSAAPPPALAANTPEAPAQAPTQMTPIPTNEPGDTDQEEDDQAKEFDEATNPKMAEKIGSAGPSKDNFGHISLPGEGQSVPDYTNSVNQTLDQQANLMAQDFASGKITPKTYHQLWAKNADGSDRGTLGKIGMIFSLMLGGAGAGLTHGPNAALGMMDKMIDNDLQAQKANKANQMSFVNMANNFYKTKSDVALQGIQGELYGAKKQEADINNQILTQNLHKTGMMLSAVHSIYGLTDKIPPGSEKAQALQSANAVHSAVNQKIAQDNAKTAAAVGANSEKALNDRTQQMRGLQMLGQEGAGEQVKYNEEHQIPGVGTTTVPVNEQTRDRVLKINNFQNLINEAKDYQKKAELGALTPAQKARGIQLKNDLVSSYNDVKGLNRFTGNEEALYDKVVPNLGSNVGALTGSQKALLDRLDTTVQQKKDLEYKQLGVKPFTDNQSGSIAPTGKSSGEISLPYKGKTAVYDAKTKKFLRWSP